MASVLSRSVLVASVVLAGVLPAGVAGAAVQRSIINTGFDDPFLVPPATAADQAFFSSGTYVQKPGAWVAGWDSTLPLLELWRSGFQGVPARNGSAFAELNSTAAGRLDQSVCLVNGDVVPWSFSHRGRSGTDVAKFVIGGRGLGSGTEIVRVSTGRSGALGNVVSTTTGTSSAPAPSGTWTDYSGQFTWTGGSGTTSIGFEAVSAAGGVSIGNFLDNISIALTPYVDVGTATTSATETDGAAGRGLPTIAVSGLLPSAMTVSLAVTGGTAVEGRDFTLDDTLTIPAGNYDGTTPFTLPITVLNNTRVEDDRTIVVSVQPSPGAYVIQSTAGCGDAPQTAATLTILDDDTALPDVANTGEDGVVTFNPLANDDASLVPETVRVIDPRDDRCKQKVTITGVGTVSADPDTGKVTFTADPGFDGTASIGYCARDAAGEEHRGVAKVTVPLGRTSLTIRTTPDRRVVRAGGTIRYTIRATVRGPARAKNVVVCQRLGASQVYLTTDGGRLRQGQLCWTRASAKAGTVMTFHVRVGVPRASRAERVAAPASVDAGNARRRADRAGVRVIRQAAAGSGGVTG